MELALIGRGAWVQVRSGGTHTSQAVEASLGLGRTNEWLITVRGRRELSWVPVAIPPCGLLLCPFSGLSSGCQTLPSRNYPDPASEGSSWQGSRRSLEICLAHGSQVPCVGPGITL